MYNKTEMSAGSNDEAPPKSSKSQDSFLKRSLRTIKLRQVLRDIEEARTLGVDLFTLSLGEFYARLAEVRRQLRQHMNSGQGADTFAYDNMEDAQIRWASEPGLDELKRKVLRDHDRHKKRRRSASRKASKSRRSGRRAAKNK